MQYRPAKASATQRIRQLTLSPNPVGGELTVNGIDELGEYVILDITGKLIQRGSVRANRLPVGSLVPGNYILEFRQGKAAYHFTFVKE